MKMEKARKEKGKIEKEWRKRESKERKGINV